MKASMLKKTWERCKSFGYTTRADDELLIVSSSPQNSYGPLMMKSKSWSSFTFYSPQMEMKGRSRFKQESGRGCFSVYVGPEKQRFVMKVEWTSHPLFRVLLEEAELEYGFNNEGPIVLPCDVDEFIKVLLEMEMDNHNHKHKHKQALPPNCFTFTRTNSLSYQPLSPSTSSTSAFNN